MHRVSTVKTEPLSIKVFLERYFNSQSNIYQTNGCHCERAQRVKQSAKFLQPISLKLIGCFNLYFFKINWMF